MENRFDVDLISPYFSGSFSILIKISVTSLFYRFNLVKNSFSSKNSFFDPKNFFNYVLGLKFHKICLFYHLLFLLNFLFQYSSVIIVFSWIKYLIYIKTNETKKSLKFGKWTSIFVTDFFPVRNSEIYFFLFKLVFLIKKNLMLKTYLLNYLLRLKKINSNFDSTEMLIFKTQDIIQQNFVLKFFLSIFKISLSSFCKIKSLIRKLNHNSNKKNSLSFVFFKKILKKEAVSPFPLEKTIFRVVDFFFQKNYFSIFYKYLEKKEKENLYLFMEISFLNPSIFQKFFSFAIKRNTTLCFERSFSSSFYFIEKQERNYNFSLKKYKLEFIVNLSSKVSSSFDLKFTEDFFQEKFNFAKYEQFLVFDKFNDLIQTKAKKRKKENFQKMINNKALVKNFKKLLNYEKKKKFSLEYFSESFFKLFQCKNHFFISNLLDFFKIYNEQPLRKKERKRNFKTFNSYKKKTQINCGQLSTKIFEFSLGFLLKFFSVYEWFCKLLFFNQKKLFRNVYSYQENCSDHFRKPFVLWFFEKIKKTEPHLSRETRNEDFKNKFFPVSKIPYFLKFLEFQNYFLFFPTTLKFITSIKNFLVEIFWEKNFSFFSNIIYFVQLRNQKNFMSKLKNILSDYLEKWSNLGSFFLKRKKTKIKIENKNFKNLIQVFSKKKIF
jgi:hypothetical protein